MAVVIPGPVFVCYSEYRGCPYLGGYKCIAYMQKSIRGRQLVHSTEVICFSECPLREVPL